jgi:CRP/FNR family transcriptional regulator, cyclic AMP receptor protein
VIQPLLDHLDEADRRQLLARMTRRAFRKGDTLFHEGDLGDTVHLLVKGRVAVRVTTPAGDVATLTVLGAGASFGEQALLSSDARRTASVVALEAVETRLLHRRDFDDLRARQGDADRFLVDVLAEQVRRLTGHVVEALYEPAETRVMRRLRDLVELYDEGADSVDVGVRQEDLASMAGTTRPTANRVLKQLADDGVLTLGRGRMLVHERAELQRRAG